MRRSSSFPSRLEDPRIAQRRWLSASVEAAFETLGDLVIPDEQTLIEQRTQRALLDVPLSRSRPGSPDLAISLDVVSYSPTKASRIRRHQASTAISSPASAPTRRRSVSPATQPEPTKHVTASVVRLSSGVLLGCCVRWPAQRKFPLIASIEEGGVLHQAALSRLPSFDIDCSVIPSGMWLFAACWMLDAGSWMLGAGCWVLGAGCYPLCAACCMPLAACRSAACCC